MRLYRKNMIAGVLSVCMLAGSVFVSLPVHAAEETAQETPGSGAAGDNQNAKAPEQATGEATQQANEAGQDTETDAEQNTQQSSGQSPEQNADQNAEQNTDQNAEQNAEQNTGQDTDQSNNRNTKQGARQEPQQNADASESQSDNDDNAESGDSIRKQQDLAENSWRYKDGKLLGMPQYRARTKPYADAWNKVNGVYMNSAGEPIEGATQKGIDVSEHQKKIDWEKVKADGIDFAIIRCGYGNDFADQDDEYWAYNVAECERLGIPYGVYIYSYAINVAEAKSEAEHVLRLISGRSLAYPVYFDMEDKSTIEVTAAVKGQIAQTFCDIIAAKGYEVGIYANLNWWSTYLTSSVFDNTSWSKWVAQYNTTCDYGESYDIWQSTSEGKVAGIGGNVDLNFWMNVDKTHGNTANSSTTLAVRRGNEYHFKYSLSEGAADVVVNYGKKTDEVYVGDWDGDGVDTLCVRRGNTYYFKNSLSDGEADSVVKYGRSGDLVLVGDWDGDGVDTLCVRRGNTYYFKNSLSDGEADNVVSYGRSGDSVLVGDWDGNGVDTLCVRRGNTYYVKNSLGNGEADAVIPYGKAADDIVVGDWNGDGIDTFCVRRANEYHIKNSIQSGAADKVVVYGRKGDVTYAGKWK